MPGIASRRTWTWMLGTLLAVVLAQEAVRLVAPTAAAYAQQDEQNPVPAAGDPPAQPADAAAQPPAAGDEAPPKSQN
jgi:hypothetical protein